MFVLGIDPALLHIGWALVEYSEKNNSFTHICSDVIKVPTNFKNLPPKLYYNYSKLNVLFMEKLNKYKIDVICLEELFLNTNPRSSMNFAASYGLILTLCYRYKYLSKHPVVLRELSPNTIKHHLTGHGKATKEEVAKYVKLVYGNSCPVFTTNDVSDALAIAYAATVTNVIGKIY